MLPLVTLLLLIKVNVVDRVRNETVPLTSGPFVVSSIQKWNEESNLIYFEASPIEKPGEKYIYTVKYYLIS